MTQTFEFDVAQKPVGPHVHSWEAIDRANGKKIDLPKGGNDDGVKNLVGRYPEIEAYLDSEYGVKTDLTNARPDDKMEYIDGGTRWTLPRLGDGVTVIVDDINRTVLSVSVTSYPPTV
ncbi:hypothetical protein AB4Z34_01620 [Ensifer sp. 2YAB10]|uniref:hypothetical protein n=1 Tax=unclassified Ensifer TaxID=2633371 RepID=UPI003F915A33